MASSDNLEIKLYSPKAVPMWILFWGVIIGVSAFIGRKITVDCVRSGPSDGQCHLLTEGALFTIEDRIVPLSAIQNVQYREWESNVEYKNSTFTNIFASVYVDIQFPMDSADLNDYSAALNREAKQDAAARFQAFLSDPTQTMLSFGYGDPFFITNILFCLALGGVYWFAWGKHMGALALTLQRRRNDVSVGYTKGGFYQGSQDFPVQGLNRLTEGPGGKVLFEYEDTAMPIKGSWTRSQRRRIIAAASPFIGV